MRAVLVGMLREADLGPAERLQSQFDRLVSAARMAFPWGGTSA
jgi:hypothetical protein